jgi:hypothetical protein
MAGPFDARASVRIITGQGYAERGRRAMTVITVVVSKLKRPLFVASEMSGFD